MRRGVPVRNFRIRAVVKCLDESFICQVSPKRTHVGLYPPDVRAQFVQGQLAFYFSDEHYESRTYPKQYADENGFVRIRELSQSGRLRAMGATPAMVAQAAAACSLTVLAPDAPPRLRKATRRERIAAAVVQLLAPETDPIRSNIAPGGDAQLSDQFIREHCSATPGGLLRLRLVVSLPPLENWGATPREVAAALTGWGSDAQAQRGGEASMPSELSVEAKEDAVLLAAAVPFDAIARSDTCPVLLLHVQSGEPPSEARSLPTSAAASAVWDEWGVCLDEGARRRIEAMGAAVRAARAEAAAAPPPPAQPPCSQPSSATSMTGGDAGRSAAALLAGGAAVAAAAQRMAAGSGQPGGEVRGLYTSVASPGYMHAGHSAGVGVQLPLPMASLHGYGQHGMAMMLGRYPHTVERGQIPDLHQAVQRPPPPEQQAVQAPSVPDVVEQVHSTEPGADVALLRPIVHQVAWLLSPAVLVADRYLQRQGRTVQVDRAQWVQCAAGDSAADKRVGWALEDLAAHPQLELALTAALASMSDDQRLDTDDPSALLRVALEWGVEQLPVFLAPPATATEALMVVLCGPFPPQRLWTAVEPQLYSVAVNERGLGGGGESEAWPLGRADETTRGRVSGSDSGSGKEGSGERSPVSMKLSPWHLGVDAVGGSSVQVVVAPAAVDALGGAEAVLDALSTGRDDTSAASTATPTFPADARFMARAASGESADLLEATGLEEDGTPEGSSIPPPHRGLPTLNTTNLPRLHSAGSSGSLSSETSGVWGGGAGGRSMRSGAVHMVSPSARALLSLGGTARDVKRADRLSISSAPDAAPGGHPLYRSHSAPVMGEGSARRGSWDGRTAGIAFPTALSGPPDTDDALAAAAAGLPSTAQWATHTARRGSFAAVDEQQQTPPSQPARQYESSQASWHTAMSPGSDDSDGDEGGDDGSARSVADLLHRSHSGEHTQLAHALRHAAVGMQRSIASEGPPPGLSIVAPTPDALVRSHSTQLSSDTPRSALDGISGEAIPFNSAGWLSPSAAHAAGTGLGLGLPSRDAAAWSAPMAGQAQTSLQRVRSAEIPFMVAAAALGTPLGTPRMAAGLGADGGEEEGGVGEGGESLTDSVRSPTSVQPPPRILVLPTLPSNGRPAWDFSAMSWNVLVDALAATGGETASALATKVWSFRGPRIKKHLLYHSPDILALQEVQCDVAAHSRQRLRSTAWPGVYENIGWRDPVPTGAASHATWLGRALHGAGYDVCFAPRWVTGSVRSKAFNFGNTIAWRKAEFEATAMYSVHLAQAVAAVSSQCAAALPSDVYPQVTPVAVLRHTRTGAVLLAASTHLNANWRQPHTQLLQCAGLSAALASLAEHHSASAITCLGDFNSLPTHACYEWMLNCSLLGDHPTVKDLAKCGLLPPGQRFTVPGVELTFTSAYAQCMGREPAYTNYVQGFEGCLDYLWTWRLVPISTLKPLPDATMTASGYLPNHQIPSDHIPLLGLFRFVDGDLVTGGL